MFKIIKKTGLVILALAVAATAAACAGTMDDVKKTDKPSAAPSAQATASAEASASPEASPMASEPAGSEGIGSAEPSLSPDVSDGADAITGFMEGVVLDPAEAPEVVSALLKKDEYRDMGIQSITYKLYEGRQAYYVVLQGDGEATHPVYVFADGSVVEDGTGE